MMLNYLETMWGVMSLLHMSIDVLSLVRLLIEIVARDIMPTYLGHRKARAANAMDLVQERGIR